ncbi:MAG: pentapeptide repeat-containing protein [Nitratireductor sp.]|nr:pentapeptide repeat-containing protein [Nitratireductor sp.]
MARRLARHLSGVAVAAGLVAAIAPWPASIANAADCNADPKPGIDWGGCRKRNLIIGGSDLSGANLSETDFTSTDLRKSGLDGADLSKANLLRSMLDSSKAAGANFEKAIGFRTSFAGTDLTAARFGKSEMQRADFTGAALANVDFEKSELGRAIFTDADINGTNFTYSNVARADFRLARFETPIDFTGAYFFLTRIEGLDLSQAVGLAQWQVDMACGDTTTKLPAGMATPTTWPCEEE